MLNTLHIRRKYPRERRVFHLDQELMKLKSGPFPQLSRLVVDPHVTSRNKIELDWKLTDDGKWLMGTMGCKEAHALWKGVHGSEYEFPDL
jgi:hypothetical protein